jgi:AAA family ATP:ADP antiporter
MASLLTKLVDFREGEGRLVLGTFLALFGIVGGHTVLETARDAIFLSRLPPSQLTLVYAAVAVGTLLLSSWNTAFVRRYGQRNALVFTLLIGAYVTMLFFFQHMRGAILYVFYTWSAVIGAMLGAQFWMYAGQIFTVAQGKRLFAPIASGGVLGAVAGASLTAAALTRLPVKTLLIGSAATFLVTAALVTFLPAGDSNVGVPDQPGAAEQATSFVELIRKVPYLQKLAVFTAFSTAALLVTDYLFKSIAAQTVPREELGLFFARTYTVFNILSLAVQLLLAGRILRRIGVVPALLVLPFCIALGSGSMVLFGGVLALALLPKGADGGLRYSLQRVASELLWMPLDGNIRNQAKALLDSTFGKVIQAVVAGLLLLLVPMGVSSPRVIALVMLGLSIAWFGSVVVLRGSYLDLFRQALRRGSIEVELQDQELDLTSVEAVLEALSSRDSSQVIAAMELLRDKKHARLVPGLILYHESPEVLTHALQVVGTPDRTDWIPLAERLLDSPSADVRVGAVRALGAAGQHEAVRRARADEDPCVRAHAALASEEDATEAVGALMKLEGEEGHAARLALLVAIADHPEDRWADLVLELALAGGSDERMGEDAAKAMSRIVDVRFIPWLVPRLGMRRGRAIVRDALVQQGEPALDALAATLLDESTDEKLRLHVPRTISRFPTQRAADLLLDVLVREKRGLVRYKALRGLGRLVANGEVKVPKKPLLNEVRKNLVETLRIASLEVGLAHGGDMSLPSGTLVLGLLGDKRRQAMERVFRLLQMAYKNEDIQRVHAAVTTGNKRLRAQALEFLDALMLVAPRDRRTDLDLALLRDDVRELLRLANDDMPDADRVARSSRFLAKTPATHGEALAVLLEDRDETLATLAAFYSLELGTPELRERVSVAMARRPLPVATPLGPALAPPSIRFPLTEAHA